MMNNFVELLNDDDDIDAVVMSMNVDENISKMVELKMMQSLSSLLLSFELVRPYLQYNMLDHVFQFFLNLFHNNHVRLIFENKLNEKDLLFDLNDRFYSLIENIHLNNIKFHVF